MCNFLAEKKCNFIGVISGKKYQGNFLSFVQVELSCCFSFQSCCLTLYPQSMQLTPNFNFLIFVVGTLDPNVLLELFTIYRDWQEEKAQNISKRQVDLFIFVPLSWS